MNKYLVVDGMISGTGIRDYYEGGYVDLSQLKLSPQLLSAFKSWLIRYWEAFYSNYTEATIVEKLDSEGVQIARLIQKEIGVKVSYYSDAMQQIKQID